ncbi:MAG: tetratricopeptide repeat protein [Opitutaceae bacterium]
MKINALLSRLGAFCAVIFFILAASQARAQAAGEVSAAKPAGIEEPTYSDLLKSYVQVRDQLHAAQLAIVNNRIESEAAARAQSAAIAEKLEAIKSAMQTERAAMQIERDRQQVDAQRERERQQADAQRERQRQEEEAQRSRRATLWLAGTGSVGLLAMLATALFQWRAINRMTDVTGLRPQLAAPAHAGLLAGENAFASDQNVAVSNQRLLSVIDRMERRIFELEHTASPPLAAAPVVSTNGTDSNHRTPTVSSDQAAWIAVLLAKGRSLLATNKAQEAVVCYDEILKLDLQNPEALVKKGTALERLNRDDEALRCYNRAIEADRKMTLAYLYKGGVCNRLGRYEDALECYEQALRAEEKGK